MQVPKSSTLLLPLLYFVLLGCSLCSCDSGQSKQDSSKAVMNTDLKVGGLYIIRDKDSSFHAVKILVLDDDAVHMRAYSNSFKTEPKELSSDSLDILLGHAPVSKEGFLADNPKLIKVEDVKDEELEGYKLYLEMNKAPK
jgi:hypothetical protein